MAEATSHPESVDESQTLGTRGDAAPSVASSELVAVLLRTLRSIDRPLTAAKLRGKLPPPFQRDPGELEAILERCVASGDAHRFKPYQGKANRFFAKPPLEYAETLIVQEMVGRYETKAAIQKRFRAKLSDLREAAIGALVLDLVKQGKLYAGTFLGGRSKRFSASPLDHRALLDDAIDQIAKRCSMSRDQVASCLSKLDAPVDPQPTQDASSTEAVPPESSTPETIVLDAISELCPPDGSAVLPIADLRDRLNFQIDPQTLDNVLLSLVQRGTIDLNEHPDPGSLSPAQRERCLTDASGRVHDMLVLRMSVPTG